MTTKTGTTENSINPVNDEAKEQGIKYSLSKFEYDLYHEEDDVPEKVIRVKRIGMPNKGCKWKIFEDNKAVFVVDGLKLTNKEKDFLGSVEGFNFLIAQYKLGINSFNHLRGEIKKQIK